MNLESAFLLIYCNRGSSVKYFQAYANKLNYIIVLEFVWLIK
jgi:hypothetical protein